MFSKTLSSVDYNKTSAEWNYVHEDLKESVVGVMYWIPLLLWNVSCWEDPGCEDKASVERPLLGQGQSRGPGRGSLCGAGIVGLGFKEKTSLHLRFLCLLSS